MAKPFVAGDKVFAKVRGYRPWPATVEGLADNTPNSHVSFFGTPETSRAVCKTEDLYHYAENKEKYGKPSKRRDFNEALAQIEGLSPVPRFIPRVEKVLGENGDTNVDENQVIDETPGKRAEVKTKAVKRKRGGNITAESNHKNVHGDHLKEDIECDGQPAAYPRSQLDEQHGRQKQGNNTNEAGEIVDNQKDQEELLKVKARMVELDFMIRSHVTLTRANPEQCMTLLDDMYALELCPFMLKEYPRVVQTIKMLRKYAGNASKWGFSKEEKIKFKQDAALIRSKAERIYKKFNMQASKPLDRQL